MNKRWLAGCLAGSLVVVSGCSAVGGFDPKVILENEKQVVSYEGNMTLSFDFDVEAAKGETNGDPISSEDIWTEAANELKRTHYRTLDGMKLSLTSLSLNNADSTVSAKGTLEKADRVIPFELSADRDTLVVKVEGLSRPLVIETMAGMSEIPQEFAGLVEQATEVSNELGSFLVLNLPNAADIKAEKKSEKLQGGEVQGTALSLSVQDEEFPVLLQKYLKNLTLDDAGLHKLAEKVYEAAEAAAASEGVRQLMQQMEEERGEEAAEAQEVLGPVVESFFFDKEVTVEGLYGMGKSMFATAAAASSQWKKADAPKDTKAVMTLFADDKQQWRKAGFEFESRDARFMADGVKSGKVSLSLERWNVNGKVATPQLSSANGIDPEAAEGADEMLEALDERSDLYKFLKEDLKLMHKELQLYYSDKAELQSLMNEGPHPEVFQDMYYITDGKGYGSVRELAEAFGGEVSWNAADKTVRVESGGRVVELTDPGQLFGAVGRFRRRHGRPGRMVRSGAVRPDPLPGGAARSASAAGERSVRLDHDYEGLIGEPSR
ncbi:copper amine oxidase domain-containing protein [Paenibacillus mucilaginosus 3016]|uniref:Copper amine oxidase domain-containing protein n=1 Tax=Paenibacillus mucilaginosus 3016 TaxID=1116391 RepID=H6NHN4_9BACL|nr:copper amine oxidase domain-containing protein [Paenibacillus mucilaginosus 3016]